MELWTAKELENKIPGYTCPLIDSVLKKLEDVENTAQSLAKEAYRVDPADEDESSSLAHNTEWGCGEIESSVSSAESELEDIRAANSQLREAAENFKDYYLDLADEYDVKSNHLEEAEEELSKAFEEIDELRQRIRELETSPLSKLREYMRRFGILNYQTPKF